MALYRRKNSPFWWYSFKLAGHKRVAGSTETGDKKLALQIYHAQRSEAQKIQYEFERPRVSLGDLIRDYLELYSKHSKLTYEDDIGKFKKIKDFFGDVMLYEIIPARLEEYRIKRLSDGVTKITVNREMGLLIKALNGINARKIL